MSDDRRQHDDHERVVDEFFAAHRRQVVDQPTDDETWQLIRERAGRSPRSRGMWFLAGAVAASAVGAAVLVGQGLGGPQAGPAATPGDNPVAVTAPVTPAPSASAETSGQADAETTTNPPADEPSEGATSSGEAAPTQDGPTSGTLTLPAPDPDAEVVLVREPTGEESQLRTAVYETDCAAAAMEWACPGLAVSEDAGQTWTPRVDMFESGYYAAVSSRERTWMWAAGGDRPGIPEVQKGLVRSDDGGRTWSPVATRGDGVLWAEAFRSTLVVVTQGCEAGSADSCAEVVVTDVDADDATRGRRVVALTDLPPQTVAVPAVLPEGGIQATYDAVYVHLPWRGVSYRIADGEETATRLDRPGCTVSTAPESQDSVLSWCPGEATLQLSADGGTTWADVDGPGGGIQQVASNDGTRLVVATDEALWVGTSGTDWEEVVAWAPGRTMLRALGGGSMVFGGPYRWYPDGPPELSSRWVTDDDWRTWTEEPHIEVTGAG